MDECYIEGYTCACTNTCTDGDSQDSDDYGAGNDFCDDGGEPGPPGYDIGELGRDTPCSLGTDCDESVV